MGTRTWTSIRKEAFWLDQHPLGRVYKSSKPKKASVTQKLHPPKNKRQTTLPTPWLAVLPAAAASPPALPPPSAPTTSAAAVESACPAPAHTRFGSWSQPAVTTAPHLATSLSPVCPPASCSTPASQGQTWRATTSPLMLLRTTAVTPASPQTADAQRLCWAPANEEPRSHLSRTHLPQQPAHVQVDQQLQMWNATFNFNGNKIKNFLWLLGA